MQETGRSGGMIARDPDNWHWLDDLRERRLVQNRLAQRKRRQRLAETKAQQPPQPRRKTSRHEPDLINLNTRRPRVLLPAQSAEPERFQDPASTSLTSNEQSLIRTRAAGAPTQRDEGLALTITNITKLFQLLRPSLLVARELGMPDTSIYSALFQNGQILGINCGNTLPRCTPNYGPLPQSLCPTELQLTVTHQPYIDCLPFPRLRDNLIISSGTLINDKEFCADLIVAQGNFFRIDKGKGGWDSAAWVMSSAFKQKWGFLFL